MNYMKVHATYSNQIEHCNLWLVSVLSIQIHFRSLTSAETMLGTLENCSLSLIMYTNEEGVLEFDMGTANCFTPHIDILPKFQLEEYVQLQL